MSMFSNSFPIPVLVSGSDIQKKQYPRATKLKERVQKSKEAKEARKAEVVRAGEGGPDVSTLVGFIMQAEELSEGNHQDELVEEVAAELGALIFYIEILEKQRDNLKENYLKLIKSKGMSTTPNLSGVPF